MNKLKTYFVNLWQAILGQRKYSLPPGVYRVETPIVILGGGGSGEEKPK
jgi:hypothetical protein